MRKVALFTGVAGLALLLASGAGAVTAGPDDFGYTAADEAESGVTYGWVDMSGGTDITSALDDDDQEGPITLPFTFTFYGEDFGVVYVLTNGVLVFEPLLSSEYSPFHGTQCPLPKEDEVDGMVSFYQRDFNSADSACGSGCWIRHASGTTPQNWWGVTFNEVVIYRESGSTEDPDPVSVQVILFEDNTIKVNVRQNGLDDGEDAMIGVEAQDGVAGLSFPGCLQVDGTRDLMAVVFTPPTSGTPVVPVERVGWARPSNTVTHEFTAFNLDSTDVTFDISAVGTPAWTTTPSTTSLTVTAGSSATFNVTVDIPSTAVGGDSEETTIRLHPTSGGAGDKDVTTITLVQDDPDSWQRFTFMPITVDRPASAVLGDDIWLVSGYQYDALSVRLTIMDTLQVLNTDLRVWDHSDAALGGTLTPLEFGTGQGAACGMNGNLYVTGGQTGDTDTPVSDALRIYNASTSTWSTGAVMPEPRFEHAMVCDETNSKAYVIGGFGTYDTDGYAYPQTNLWVYDASADSWDTTKAQHPDTRSRHDAEFIDADTILVAGGTFGGYYSSKTHTYTISTDTWAESGDLVWERFHAASGVLPTGRMCLAGGTSFADLPTTLLEDTYECYSAGYWIPQIATMNPPARTYTVGETVDDRIYAIGGVETDTLGWPPTQYDQTGLIDRYPSGTMPDTPPDAVTDAPTDAPTDTPDDTPGDVVLDVPTDAPTDTTGDTPIDIPSDNGGDGDEDSGCGCTIVH